MLLHYKKIGTGKPVVLIHGFLENNDMWSQMSEQLAADYRLILPDLAGHGKSEVFQEIHTMQFQAEKIMEILDKETIEKATFIGHSMGGYIALAIASQFPERVNGLCLFYSTSTADSAEKKKQRLQAVETVKKNKNSFIEKAVPGLFRKDKKPQLKEEIERAISWAKEMPVEGVTAALKGMRERADTTEILKTADFPIQIILGTHDEAVKANEFQKVIPERNIIQTAVLPTGHMGHLEAPKRSLELINQFLIRV